MNLSEISGVEFIYTISQKINRIFKDVRITENRWNFHEFISTSIRNKPPKGSTSRTFIQSYRKLVKSKLISRSIPLTRETASWNYPSVALKVAG